MDHKSQSGRSRALAWVLVGQVSTFPLRKAYVVIFTTRADFCGDFHHMSKSPQIFVAVFTTCSNHHIPKSPQILVVILFKVGPKVREHHGWGMYV